MQWRRLLLLILISALALAVPAHAQSDFKFTKVDFELLHLSDQLDDYFMDHGMVFEDDATTQYVESVGRSVLPPGAPPEHVTWRFHVLRDPLPNAFALPNGSIYIHTGLLSLMRNEAQLAAVLGHEETHVLNRHPYLEYRSARKKQVAINVLSIAGAGASPFGLAGLGAEEVVDTVAPALIVATYFGYSREIEQQADMRGLHAMEQAGYDPEQMPETFRLLEQSEGPDSGPSLYRDHPRLEARIQYLTADIKAHPSAAASPRVNERIYSDATEKVCRHDIGLEIAALRPRRAVAIARHLADTYPSSDHYFLLGEAYRAMGGRLPDPTEEQLDAERKLQKKLLSKKMTPQEYEKSLLDTPEGKTAWQENRKQAEAAYKEAIRFDDSDAPAHRGLAMMYDDAGNAAEAAAEYQKYLQLVPAAWDHEAIQKRIATLQAPPAPAQTPPAGAAHAQQPGGTQP